MARVCARRRVRFESLEPRQMLAGDVVLNVVHGHLMVEGDALDNKIMITAGAEAGAFVVTGLDGTTVHLEGEAAAADPVTVTGVHSIRAALGEGDDLVAVVGANLRGSLGIRTGAGEDRVLVGTGGDAAELVGLLPDELAVNVRGSVHIATNGGNDQVAVDDARVGGLLRVDAGLDDDSVALGGPDTADLMSARLRVRGGVHVSLGQGNDELNMERLRVGGGIVARGGAGDDTVNATLTHSFGLVVLGDGGVDTIAVDHVQAHHLGIHTGEGSDNVEVRDSAFAALGVALGDGDDTLATGALEARVAILLGGDGEDTLNVISESNFLHEVIQGFEIPPDINVGDLPFVRRPLGRLIRRLV